VIPRAASPPERASAVPRPAGVLLCLAGVRLVRASSSQTTSCTVRCGLITKAFRVLPCGPLEPAIFTVTQHRVDLVMEA